MKFEEHILYLILRCVSLHPSYALLLYYNYLALIERL